MFYLPKNKKKAERVGGPARPLSFFGLSLPGVSKSIGLIF